MAQELDNLQIVISADTKNAVKDIQHLTKSLRSLRDTFKSLNTNKAELRVVYSTLKDISNIDFSRVEASLGHLATIISNLDKFNKKNVQSALEAGAVLTGETVAPITQENTAVKDETATVDANTTAINENKQAKNSWLDSIKEITKNLPKISINLDKTNKHFRKLFASIKRIALYRAIRTIMKIIVNAFKTGIQAIAQFDSATNEAMSRLKSSWETLKLSLGSLVAPIIQMVTPALVQLMDSVTKVTNQLAELFAVMNGQDVFLKAKEQVVDYAESLKKANGSNLGIDELNVIKGDDNADKYEDVAVSVEESTANMLTDIKKAFGKLWELIRSIGAKLMEIINKVVKILVPVIVRIVDLLEALMPLVDAIVVVIDSLLPLIDTIFDIVLSLLETILPPIVNIISAIAEPVARIVDFINSILRILQPIINLIGGVLAIALNEILKILRPIFNIISLIFDTFAVMNEILQPIVDTFAGMFLDLFNINDGVNLLAEGLNLLIPVVKVIGALFRAVGVAVLGICTALSYALETVVNVAKTARDIFTFNWGAIGGDWTYEFSNGLKEQLTNLSVASGFATGGFPEDGFFFANHNELVGRFANGQTAVANNEQIIEGIKQGVMEAMEQSGGANVSVYLDSREISAKVIERTNNKGATIITGGTLSYGK